MYIITNNKKIFIFSDRFKIRKLLRHSCITLVDKSIPHKILVDRVSFLVGAFLEKRVDYSHGFSSVFFLRPPALTKIVLPKVLQNFKFHLLAQGTEPKNFPHNIQSRTRPKGPPFSFLALRDFFSEKFFSPKCPPSIFLGFATDWDNTLKLCCLFPIFEPWIWRRLGPVPACFLFVQLAKQRAAKCI